LYGSCSDDPAFGRELWSATLDVGQRLTLSSGRRASLSEFHCAGAGTSFFSLRRRSGMAARSDGKRHILSALIYTVWSEFNLLHTLRIRSTFLPITKASAFCPQTRRH